MAIGLVLSSLLHVACCIIFLRVIAIDTVLYICLALFSLTSYLSFKELVKPAVWILEKDEVILNHEKEPESIKDSKRNHENSADGLRRRNVKSDQTFKVIQESETKMRIEDPNSSKPFLKACPLFKPEQNLTFARMGYVGSDSAKLFFRVPPQVLNIPLDETFDASILSSKKIIVKLSEIKYKGQGSYKNSLTWINETEYDFPSSDSDYTGTHEISSLKPSTLYYIQASLKDNVNSLLDLEFKTSPYSGSPTKLTFGTGSCVKPNFPYFPGIKPHLSGFRQMAKHSLDFIMFLGDFIYSDCPFYYGSSLEDYRRLYRQVYTTDDTKDLVKAVPMYHIYDDHEIVDNWDKSQQHPYNNAIKAYWEYNGAPNPISDEQNSFYYNFTYGNIAFYVFDTRGHRDNEEKPDGPEKTMLGSKQKSHFFRWLKETNHTAAVKFVVSSVPLTYVWDSSDAGKDTWKGYKYERKSILDQTKYVPNLFFLSGDRHEVAVVRLASDNYEFSTSPINQFSLPFVNGHVHSWGGDITEYYQQVGQTKYGILNVDTESNVNIPKVSYSLYTNADFGAEKPAYVFEADCVEWRA
ncbi:Alkaline phosphatase D [Smittium mucronatum]|uniref:Alkaline phosphatase D n=1 Tax=Smittium mucronatum TaxID=133383 RepID=A0A1R0GW65_9FUNG|nr:Alkaline phosphatase D [Smittium mucronatum]